MKSIINKVISARSLALMLITCFASSAWADATIAAGDAVTGSAESYTYYFTGANSGDWSDTGNWANANGTAYDGSTSPALQNSATWDPILFDGTRCSGNKTISTTTVDGWALRMGLYNGVNVTMSGLKYWWSSNTSYARVDSTSKLTVNNETVGGTWAGRVEFVVAAADGIEFTGAFQPNNNNAGAGNIYYTFIGDGTVKYDGVCNGGVYHRIQQAEATLSYPAEKMVKRKKLVSFSSATVRFKTTDSTVIKLGSSSIYFTAGDVPTATSLTTDSPVGACEIVQLPNDTEDEDGPGVYLYYVDGKPKAISINFGSGSASIGNDVEVGLVPVKRWLNTSDAGSSSSYYPETQSSLAISDSEGTAYNGMKLYVRSRGGNYNSKGGSSTPVEKLLYGFMDNNNYSPNKNAGVKITGVRDFASRYSVYVYFSRDSAEDTASAFPPYWINGIPYYGDGSKTLPGYQVWGTIKKSSIANGVNTLVVHGLTDDTLVVSQPNDAGGRGCIAGIQIVEDSESGLETPIKYVSVTAPSEDWDSLILPTLAYGVDVASSTIDFASGDTRTAYYQILGNREAIVADISSTSVTVTEAATMQTEKNNKSCGDRDLYLLVNGGPVERAIGILNQDYDTSNGTQSGGNAMVQIGGNATVSYAFGAGYEGYGGTAPGSTGVTIKDNATLTGSAFGGWASQHNQSPAVNGNTSVKVLNLQNTNTATADSTISNNAIVGGSGYRSNGWSGAKIKGSSSVIVDLSELNLDENESYTFGKQIIGGCAQLVNNATTQNAWEIDNNSSVTITAPNNVTFSQNIVGGSYVVSGRTATMTVGGTSSVTLNGGNYSSCTITAGGSGSGTQSGASVITVNGGVFTSATLSGGNATGTKKLVLNQAVDPSSTTISGFTVLEIGDEVAQSNISTLTGLTALTIGAGSEYSISAGDEGRILLNGGTLKLTVTSAQITSGYTPTIDEESTGGTVLYYDEEGTQLTADVFDNVLLPEGGGSSPYVIEIDGDATYEVIRLSNFAGGITVKGSGTLTFDSPNSSTLYTTTVSLEDGANLTVKNNALSATTFTAEENTQILTIDETTTFRPAPTFTTVKVQGAGTVVYTLGTSGSYVASAQMPFTDAGWTGTVELRNCYLTSIDFSNYGNANSTVRANGVTGYLKYDNQNNDVAAIKTLEIASGGLHLNNALNKKRFIFAADITGNGQFDCGTSSSGGNISQYIFKGDVNGFEGGIRFYKDGSDLTSNNAAMIYILASDASNPDFSADATYVDHGRIFIGEGASATIAAGAEWRTPYVENKCSWTVNGTLNVKGTIYGGYGNGSQGRVKGNGTVIFRDRFPSGSEYGTTWWNGPDWAGTLEITNVTTETAFYLQQLGSSASTVRLSGFTGPMASGGNAIKQLEIGAGGWTLNGTFAPTIPAKLAGSGLLTISTTGDANKNICFTGDASEFTGQMTFSSANKSRIVLGTSTEREFVANSIVVGTAFNIASDWYYKNISGGIFVDAAGSLTMVWAKGALPGSSSKLTIGGYVKSYGCKSNYLGYFEETLPISIEDTGVLEFVNADIKFDQKGYDYSKITGTGTIRYTGAANGSSTNWRTLQNDAAKRPATTLVLENNMADGFIFVDNNNTTPPTIEIGSLKGNGVLRSDWGGNADSRNVRINQSKNTTWSGTFHSDERFKTFYVTGGGILTWNDTKTDYANTFSIGLEVENTGKVNLTGYWPENVTVDEGGTLGGTGTIRGTLSFADGSTLRVFGTDVDGLTASGNVTLAEGDSVSVVIDNAVTLSDGLVLMTYPSTSTIAGTFAFADSSLNANWKLVAGDTALTIAEVIPVDVGYVSGSVAVVTNTASTVTIPANSAAVAVVPTASTFVIVASAAQLNTPNFLAISANYGASGVQDITSAFTSSIIGGDASAAQLRLTLAKENTVSVNEETIYVEPKADTSATPMAMDEDETSFAIKTIPGLWYSAWSSTTIDASGDLTGSVDKPTYPIQATSTSTQIDNGSTEDSVVRYYKIAVGVSKDDVK